MNSIEVKLSDRTVIIEKLRLRQYAEVLKTLQKAPEILESIAGKNNSEIFKDLPSLIATALPEIVNLLAVVTPLKESEVEDLGLDEVLELLVATIKVNQIGRVAENFKKLLQPTPKTGSTPSSTSSPTSMGGQPSKS